MIYVVIYALLVLRFQQTVARVYHILNYKVFQEQRNLSKTQVIR